MNYQEPKEWRQYCSLGTLEFRAACNMAVEPSQRPVKNRVIERLVASPDAQKLFAKHWRLANLAAGAGATPANAQTDPGVNFSKDDRLSTFWDSLTKDDSWRTLVIEMVEQEKRWRDLLKGKPSELISKLIEKLQDKGHPAARAATATVAALSTLWVANQAAPKALNELTLPINVVVKGDKTIPVSLVSGDNSPLLIPIKLSSDSGGDGALKVTFNPKEVPIQVCVADCSANGRDKAGGLQSISAQLALSNESLKAATMTLNKVAGQPIGPELHQLQGAVLKINDSIQSADNKLQT